MLHFLKELRSRFAVFDAPADISSATIGFVGGSDLVKQQEQLGRNGIAFFLDAV